MKPITELSKISKQGEKIKSELQLLVLNLPDNSNTNRLSENPHVFTMSSSQVFNNAKNNQFLRLDPFFYDFKAQYKYISEVINKSRPDNVVLMLQQIVWKGKHKDKTNYKSFNPAVINHLRKLMKTQ